MRILEIETFGRGGLTHYAYNLSRALAERGHEVTFVTTAGYELEDRAEPPASLRIIKHQGRAGHRFGASLPAFAHALVRKVEAVVDALRVARLARRLRPDVIHLHCTNPIALAYLACLRRLGRPLVATAHVVTPHERIRLQRPVYQRIHGLGDLIVAHSEFDRARLLEEFGIEAERVAVIPHGDYGFFQELGERTDRESARTSLGLGADEEVVLFFGYLREYKGLDILLVAWPDVLESVPGARLVIAGDPVRLGAERRRDLEQRAQRLGAVCHFTYIPFSEVSGYFAAADVLVMPYRHISQSGVLYLALALGVAVVATRVGALPEMLTDGESALLVPPERPRELASALARALNDPPLRRRLARGGKRIAELHSWPAVAERTEREFARIVDH